MNILSRIVLIIYSVLWMGACGGLIVMAWNDDQKLDIEAGDLNIQAFITSGDAERWLFSVLLGALGVMGLLTLLLAVIPGSRRSSGSIQMRGPEGGVVEVQASAIEALLRQDLEQLPDVRSAHPVVRASGNTVETDIRLAIEPTATIADVTALASETTVAVLREQVGATQVRNPVLRIAYDPGARPHSPAKPGPAAMAAPPSPLPPPPVAPAAAETKAEAEKPGDE